MTRVTLLGAVGNFVLTLAKFVAGVIGMSAAMVADAIHSLSDLVSDLVVIIMVRVSSKGIDKSHDYGHGKFETLATAIIAIMLLIAGSELLFSGFNKIYDTLQGTPPPAPRYIALWAAIASIVIKEILYQWTYRVGKRVNSPAMISNAWHHRTDALSSVASAIGIGGAIALGGQWAILDPIVCCIISVFIIIIALKMILPTIHELTEGSLPEETEQEIIRHIVSVNGVKNVHNLKTRHNGPVIILSAHVVVDPQITVAEAHKITVEAENAIRDTFGSETQISIHVEPNEDAD
ncbi:MAG: cation diffusion facilitator family transporter [Bacteroidaceae bacterium]